MEVSASALYIYSKTESASVGRQLTCITTVVSCILIRSG